MNIVYDMDNSGSKIDVSVVLLTYCHEQYVSKALDTILSQKFDGSYEIVIADDCSSDNTLSIVNEYRTKYPKLIIVKANSKNIGISRNEYEAYLVCRGKYIVTTAGDDYWLDDNLIQEKYNFLEAHPDYIADASVVEAIYTDGTSSGQILPRKIYWGKEYKRNSFEHLDYYQDHALMFRNVLLTEDGRKKFSLIPEFSRDLDDVTFRFFLFDYGKIHIDDHINYAFLVRREEDIDQHNYNTKYKRINNTVNFINLINKLNDYYDGKVNFYFWYKDKMLEILYYSIFDKDLTLLKYVNLIPLKYKIRTVISIPFEACSYILRSIKRGHL